MSDATATKATATEAQKKQQDRLQRNVEYVAEEGIHFPRFTDVQIVMRAVCSKQSVDLEFP